MSASTFLQYIQFAYFSSPAADRCLFRAIRRLRARTIVEMGLATARRSMRLIRVAQRYASDASVEYTGIDLFEARPSHQAGCTIKQAHQALSSLGARVHLIPGDPFSTLSRSANSLAGTDLLIISADLEPQSLRRAWFYVPRMLHERSCVLWEVLEPTDGRLGYRELASADIKCFAQQAAPQGKKAA